MSDTTFFVWYETNPESLARRIVAECPSRAGRDYHEDPPYKIKLQETVMVRNMAGQLFRYTQDQLYSEKQS